MDIKVMYEHTVKFPTYEKASEYLKRISTLAILMRYIKHRIDGQYEVVFHAYQELEGSKDLTVRRIEIPQQLHDNIRRTIIHMNPDPFIK